MRIKLGVLHGEGLYYVAVLAVVHSSGFLGWAFGPFFI
jgi:hypothetical protein